MSLFSIFEVAGSGMNAQTLRLNLTASNMANAESMAGSEAEAYRSRQPVFQALVDRFNGSQTGGVRLAGVVESTAPIRARFEPDNPLAGEDGKVFMGNVDVTEEMVNMISASRSFQNNVEVFNTSKELLMRTLTLGQ